MYVIARKINEGISIKLGDTEVDLKVVSLKGNTARIGVSAPKSVRITRTETKERD